jgi:hypothetical protein
MPHRPALSPFIGMMTHSTRQTQRHMLWYLQDHQKLLECYALNTQNPTTHSLNILQINPIWNMTSLKEKRNPNNKSVPWAQVWRNGSRTGTPTSRNCFATMDEKGSRKLSVQTAVIGVISRAMTVPTACTTAGIVWSIAIVLCFSIGLRYEDLSYRISNLIAEIHLALDRFILRKDFIAEPGSSDSARSLPPIIFLLQSHSEELCHRRPVWHPHRRHSILCLP